MFDHLAEFADDETSEFEGLSLLITFVKEEWHSLLKVKDHLAEHAVGPTEPVEVLSACSGVAGL